MNNAAQHDEAAERLLTIPSDPMALADLRQHHDSPRAFLDALRRLAVSARDPVVASSLLVEAATTAGAELGDLPLQVELLKRAVADDPTNRRALRALTQAYDANGNHEALGSVYSSSALHLAETSVDDPSLRTHAAETYVKLAQYYLRVQNDEDKAADSLRRAIELCPESEEATAELHAIEDRRRVLSPELTGAATEPAPKLAGFAPTLIPKAPLSSRSPSSDRFPSHPPLSIDEPAPHTVASPSSATIGHDDDSRGRALAQIGEEAARDGDLRKARRFFSEALAESIGREARDVVRSLVEELRDAELTGREADALLASGQRSMLHVAERNTRLLRRAARVALDDLGDPDQAFEFLSQALERRVRSLLEGELLDRFDCAPESRLARSMLPPPPSRPPNALASDAPASLSGARLPSGNLGLNGLPSDVPPPPSPASRSSVRRRSGIVVLPAVGRAAPDSGVTTSRPPPLQRRGVARMGALFDALDELHVVGSLDDASELVLRLAVEVTRAEMAMVHVFASQTEEFVTINAVGHGSGALLDHRTLASDPLFTEARESHDCVTTKLPVEYARIRAGRWELARPERTVVTVPAERDGECVAVLELCDPAHAAEFSIEDRNALLFIAERFADYILESGVSHHL